MNLDTFLDSLLKIEMQLEQLHSQYTDLYKEYIGDDFGEQKILAGDKLENLIISVTHETATQIGFSRQRIIDLTNYILFRKLYKNYSDDDLENIIDNQNIATADKLKYKTKATEADGDILKELKHIRTEWNRLFNNRPYTKVKALVS